jgi:hypothetical protein
MDMNIIVKLQIEGIHRWKDCPIEEVSYLRNLHRHTFGIACKKTVTHSDRDTEFIQFKHQIKNYLQKYYDSNYDLYNFDGMSCEMIATELLQKFNLTECSVDEDGEFFGVVENKV